MSELLSEMEEGGQSVDPEFVVDATQQQHVGDSPLLPRAGEAVDKGSEEQVGTGHLDDEGEDSHLMTGSRSLEEINAEGGHDEVGGDMDVEDNRVSSDNEEGKSQNGVEEIPSALVASAKPTRLVQLPLARVKNIMKSDPDVGITSQDSIFLVAKATEQFVAYLAKEVCQRTHEEKRKVVQRKDLDICVKRIDSLLFLEGAID